MHEIIGDKIVLHWSKDELFGRLSAESIYNAHAAEDLDLLAISDDEHPFFENNIESIFAKLRVLFLPIIKDSDQGEISGDILRFEFIARQSGKKYLLSLDELAIIDVEAVDYLINNLLLQWYMTLEAKERVVYYASKIIDADTYIKNRLFRFSRPAYRESVFEVVPYHCGGRNKPLMISVNKISSLIFTIEVYGRKSILPASYEATAQGHIVTVRNIPTGLIYLRKRYNQFEVNGKTFDTPEKAVIGLNNVIRKL